MNRRIHEVLDGERDPGDLTPAERARLETYREGLEAGLDGIPDEEGPDLAPAILARLAEEPAPWETPSTVPAAAAGPSALRRLWDSLWTPQPVRVRPAWVVAGAAAALVLATLGPSDATLPDPSAFPGPDVQAAAGSPRVLVQFRLDAPEAGSVSLAGDFTGWDPSVTMHQQAPGVWSVVVPLEPGVHDYAFVVDGRQWRPDPLAPQVADGFGGTNSRLALMTPEAS